MMEEVKTSTRALLVSAVILLIILVTGPLGYKFSMVPLQPSLVSLLIAVAGGALVFLIGLVYLVIAMRSDLGKKSKSGHRIDDPGPGTCWDYWTTNGSCR